VSGEALLVLDPQRRYLAGVMSNPAVSPGVKVAWARESPGTTDDLLRCFAVPDGSFGPACNMGCGAAFGGNGRPVPSGGLARTGGSGRGKGGSPACPVCNLESGLGSTTCEACGTPLPLDPTQQAAGAACGSSGYFPGTLFRFPLRSASQAASSELRKAATSVEDVAAMLDAFARDVRTAAVASQARACSQTNRCCCSLCPLLSLLTDAGAGSAVMWWWWMCW